jgi:hypothetical protein
MCQDLVDREINFASPEVPLPVIDGGLTKYPPKILAFIL